MLFLLPGFELVDSLQVFLVVLVDVYLPDYYQLPALPLGSLVELDLVAVLVAAEAVALVPVVAAVAAVALVLAVAVVAAVVLVPVVAAVAAVALVLAVAAVAAVVLVLAAD